MGLSPTQIERRILLVSHSAIKNNYQPGYPATQISLRFPFQKVHARLLAAPLVAGTHRELRIASIAASPQGRARILPVLAQRVEIQIHRFEALLVVVEIARHALQGVERRLFGRHAVTHILDDGVRAGYSQILRTAARGPGAADVLIEPQAAAQDRRIPA